MNERIELHCHTNMSAMDGIASPEELILFAKNLGHRAIAITDHGVVQAFPEACRAGKEHGMKIIYGAEVYLLEDDDRKSRYCHVVLLVKNMTGLKNLYKLVSISHTDYLYKKPLLPKHILSAHREGLLIGSACGAGEIQTAIRSSCSDERIGEIADFYDYLEIQPHEPEAVNLEIARLGEMLGKPVVATGDVHYLKPCDSIARSILLHNTKHDETGEPPLHVKTTEEMLSELSYLGGEKAYEVILANTNLIADMIEEDIQPMPNGLILPEFALLPLPRVECPACAHSVHVLDWQDICMCRLRELYDGSRQRAAIKRMSEEMKSIVDNGFYRYYIVSLLIAQKAAKDGYLVGCRGGIGSSLVAYLLGITHVDPLEHNIPFEIFAGLNGDKQPDISLNIDPEYHSVALEYLRNIFRDESIISSGVVVTITDKNAERLIHEYFDGKGTHPTPTELKHLKRAIAGVKKTTGLHPGSVFILPLIKEVYDFTPVQLPGNLRWGDLRATHFDYRSISSTLMRISLLAQENLSMVKSMQKSTGIDIQAIDYNDKLTLDLLINADTIGIPELGTPFTRGVIKAAKPKTFDDFIKIIGLAHGTNVWLGNADNLIESGVATLAEVVALRDEIMVYLMDKGVEREISFEIMEHVRKGKGLTDRHKEIMSAVGVPEWYAASCEKIGYLLPKAHAVEYAIVSFRIAWFKAHYPTAFYRANPKTNNR